MRGIGAIAMLVGVRRWPVALSGADAMVRRIGWGPEGRCPAGSHVEIGKAFAKRVAKSKVGPCCRKIVSLIP